MKSTLKFIIALKLTLFCFSLFAPIASAEEQLRAIAVLSPASGSQISGYVFFDQDPESAKVKIHAHIEGLEPNSTHAIHIHQYGDISSPKGLNAGSHYNPENHPHNLPENSPKHAGDLGNLTANEKGVAHYIIESEQITVNGNKNPIIGRAVIVHIDVDDGGQPVGNAGARIAQGVIGLRVPVPKE